MPSPLDVVGIGNAIVDVLTRTDDAFLSSHGLAKGAMQLIDTRQADMLYAAMGPAVEISGGSAANTIAGLASLGGRAAFVGTVADDQLGKVFRHDITSLGVHYATPVRGYGDPTARCLVLVTPDGERTMNTYLGASQLLGPDDVDEELIASADIVYLEGYLFDPPAAKEAFYKAARVAHDTGGRVALSLSDAFCVNRHREAFRIFVKDEVDILFANEAEIMALYEIASFEQVCENVRRIVPISALTRSAKGSIIVADGDTFAVDADPVDTVVDTTGAGDLYAAGFLYGLSAGRHLGDCARLGSLAAAEVISHIGARPLADLKDLARARGLIGNPA